MGVIRATLREGEASKAILSENLQAMQVRRSYYVYHHMHSTNTNVQCDNQHYIHSTLDSTLGVDAGWGGQH